MNEHLIVFVIEVLAGITVTVATALFSWFMVQQIKYKKSYDAAAKIYANKIGEQIMGRRAQIQPLEFPESEDVYIRARTVVSVRNDLRARLLTLSGLLNSEIDRLEDEVRKIEENRDDNQARARAADTLEVLKNKWPIKSEQIEIEIRKLLAELGLEKNV